MHGRALVGARRRGNTIGSVYITGSKDDARILRHEAKHTDQYAIFGASTGGIAFVPIYFLGKALGGWTDDSHNVFEQWAGLQDGCYDDRPGC